MAKKPKPDAAVQPSVESTAAASAASSATAPAAEPVAEVPAVDVSKPAIQAAIVRGKALIAEGKSKADAAREIYAAIKDESKDTIVEAFVQGATLTPKGALTYWYNCRRKAAKQTASTTTS